MDLVVDPPPPRARAREEDTSEFFADPRVVAFFAFVPEHTHATWRATIAMWLRGEDWGIPPRPTPGQIAAGLAGAVTAHDGGPIGDQFVRGCIRRAIEGDDATGDRSRRDGKGTRPIPAASRARALELHAVIRREGLSLLNGPQFEHETEKALAAGRLDARTIEELRAMMPLREIGQARSEEEGKRIAIELFERRVAQPKLAVLA